MSRKTRASLAVTVAVVLVAVVALASALYAPWGSGRSAWPHVPPGKLFVMTQPKPEDVAGLYELTAQTITADGLAALGGKPCQLDLRADGSFTATHYPRWSLPASSASPSVTDFVSTTGRWRCAKLGIIYDGRECWGVVFFDAQGQLDPLALRSDGAPYDLMLIYSDADEGRVMTFERKK